MEVDIRHWVTQQPRLFTEIYDSVKHIAEFKEDMNFVSIWACKDPNQMWTTLPFIAIDEAIDVVLDTWPLEWHRPDAVEHDEATISKQKAEAKHAAQQKQNEQHAAEVRAAQEVAQNSTNKAPAGASHGEREGRNIINHHGCALKMYVTDRTDEAVEEGQGI